MTKEEIFEAMKPLIVSVLGVRPENIRLESVLVTDLGAESIDLLDLSFLIEETFGVTIEADEFERQATASMGGAPYEREGYLTDQALAQLRISLPEVPADRLAGPLKKIELPSVLNVAVFVHLIQRKLAARRQEAIDA